MPEVLVHRATGPRGVVLFAHNLSSRPRQVRIGPQPREVHRPLTLVSDAGYDDEDIDLLSLELNGYGYRWLRLTHTPSE